MRLNQDYDFCRKEKKRLHITSTHAKLEGNAYISPSHSFSNSCKLPPRHDIYFSDKLCSSLALPPTLSVRSFSLLLLSSTPPTLDEGSFVVVRWK